MRRRRLIAALVAGVLLSWGVASLDWCHRSRPPLSAPARIDSGQGLTSLRMGSGRAPIAPPWPVPLAGYGPGRPTANNAAFPLEAQALVLESQPVKVGVVTLDVLLVPEELAEDIRAGARALGISPIWVVATHSHSSMGGYDPELLAQVVGTGAYREEARRVLVDAARRALEHAAANVAAAQLKWAQTTVPELSVGRDGNEPDSRLLKLQMDADTGNQAQWLVLSGHPTLVSRSQASADPDYPGRLAALERPRHDVTLVTQGGSGNGSARVPDTRDTPDIRANAPLPDRLAEAWRLKVDMLQSTPLDGARLAFARVRVSMPCPDSSRLLPALLQRAGNSVLCLWAPPSVELGALQLGPVRLLFVPGEPTFVAAEALESAAGATRVVSLSGGYVGYVERPDRVENRSGEARRQYFPASLLPQLEAGAVELRRALASVSAGAP